MTLRLVALSSTINTCGTPSFPSVSGLHRLDTIGIPRLFPNEFQRRGAASDTGRLLATDNRCTGLLFPARTCSIADATPGRFRCRAYQFCRALIRMNTVSSGGRPQIVSFVPLAKLFVSTVNANQLVVLKFVVNSGITLHVFV